MGFEKEMIAFVGVIITIIGYSAYITSIFRNNTKPHPFSWTIWATLTAIAFFAQITDNAGPGAWITGISAGVSYFIALVGYIRKNDITITRGDWFTFIAAALCIPIWIITDTPLWSIILVTLIDTLGCYPTFRKSWFDPHSELLFHYAIAGLKFFLSLFAIINFTIITALYPASLVIINWAFIVMVYYRRWVLKNEKR